MPKLRPLAFRAALTLVPALGLSACGSYLPELSDLPLTYRIDVQQGNVVTQEMLAQLRPGMDRKQVRFIMGTPMVQDTFHADRWDYLYTFQDGRSRPERRLITVIFDDAGLAALEGDVTPAMGRLEVPTRSDKIVEVPKGEKPGLVGRVRGMFDGEDEEGLPSREAVEGERDEVVEATDPEDRAQQKLAEEAKEDEPEVDESKLDEDDGTMFSRFFGRMGFGNDDEGKKRDPERKYKDPSDSDSMDTMSN